MRATAHKELHETTNKLFIESSGICKINIHEYSVHRTIKNTLLSILAVSILTYFKLGENKYISGGCVFIWGVKFWKGTSDK